MSACCPACGSHSIESTKRKHTLPIIYGGSADYDEVVEKCLVCGESGDFSGANDELINGALEVAKKQSVIDMLDTLAVKGIKMSYMERALELPARTIARWKNGELSAATLALLRIIRTYPWILEVADAHFDQSVAKCRVVEEASHVIQAMLKPHTKQANIKIFTDNNEMLISAQLTIKNPHFSVASMKPRFEHKTII